MAVGLWFHVFFFFPPHFVFSCFPLPFGKSPVFFILGWLTDYFFEIPATVHKTETKKGFSDLSYFSYLP